jgi:hypothetical protein
MVRSAPPFFSKGRGREGFSRIDIRLGINTVFIKSPLCSPLYRKGEKEDAFGDLLFLKGICSTIVQ